MPALNTFRASMEGLDGFESLVVVTWHYRPDPGADTPTMAKFAATLKTQLELVVPAMVVSGVNFSRLVVRDEGDITLGTELSLSIAGSRAGQAMPPQIAGQVEKLTGFIGRRNRGRNYWPGPSEDDSDGGAPDATYRAALVALMESLMQVVDVDDNLYNMGVYSAVGDQFRVCTGFIAAEQWGTQTRRKPGRGT